MKTPTVTIEVAPRTAALLQAKATAQGKSLDDLLLTVFAESQEAPADRPFSETATKEEWLKAFNEWVNSHDRNAPALTLEDVSRERIYEDR